MKEYRREENKGRLKLAKCVREKGGRGVRYWYVIMGDGVFVEEEKGGRGTAEAEQCV